MPEGRAPTAGGPGHPHGQAAALKPPPTWNSKLSPAPGGAKPGSARRNPPALRSTVLGPVWKRGPPRGAAVQRPSRPPGPSAQAGVDGAGVSPVPAERPPLTWWYWMSLRSIDTTTSFWVSSSFPASALLVPRSTKRSWTMGCRAGMAGGQRAVLRSHGVTPRDVCKGRARPSPRPVERGRCSRRAGKAAGLPSTRSARAWKPDQMGFL